MEAFLTSTSAVALAEIGDKTQLLSLFLATRFKQKHWIILGILVATLINHGLSAWLGQWITQFIPQGYAHWLLGGSFIAVALWLLIPDKEDDGESAMDKYGAFVATTVLFFLAEIGDKTQVATVLLAAQYQSIFWVTAGTTLGMLLANVPVVFAGQWLMQRIPLQYTRWIACGLFVLFGVSFLING